MKIFVPLMCIFVATTLIFTAMMYPCLSASYKCPYAYNECGMYTFIVLPDIGLSCEFVSACVRRLVILEVVWTVEAMSVIVYIIYAILDLPYIVYTWIK